MPTKSSVRLWVYFTHIQRFEFADGPTRAVAKILCIQWVEEYWRIAITVWLHTAYIPGIFFCTHRGFPQSCSTASCMRTYIYLFWDTWCGADTQSVNGQRVDAIETFKLTLTLLTRWWCLEIQPGKKCWSTWAWCYPSVRPESKTR